MLSVTRAVQHVLLSGFMGAGKSTVGSLLASRLGRAFVDLDDVITAHAGSSVRALFQTEGEAGFRAREQRALRSVLRGPRAVIALGGGTVVDAENRRLARAHGHLVHLSAHPASLRARVQQGASRPLWSADFEARLAARSAAYADADQVISTDDQAPATVAEAIARTLPGTTAHPAAEGRA